MSPPPPGDYAPDANAKPETAPKRKPWVPPRFKGVDVYAIGASHQYFDYDDTQSPGGQTFNTDYHPSYDQTNPYNS